MTQTIDERLTAPYGGRARRHRSGREGVRRSLLDRIRVLHRPEPDARPWQSRPDEAYRVLEDARAVIAQGWIQDHWFARRPTSSRLTAQSFRPSDDLGDVAAACLVGAVIYAAQQRGSGD